MLSGGDVFGADAVCWPQQVGEANRPCQPRRCPSDKMSQQAPLTQVSSWVNDEHLAGRKLPAIFFAFIRFANAL
jgi:hypothetical protein